MVERRRTLPKTVAAPTVREQVANALRTAILEFRFQPGERLVERELCEMTGSSRTTVREALRHLESEGLVESLPRRGLTVAVVSPDRARHIYELRGALEALAARLFAERGGVQQIKHFEAAFKALAPAFGLQNQQKVLAAVNKYYDALLEGCGNPLIASVLRSLHGRIVYLRAISISQGRIPESLDELERIVKAVRNRDSEAAALACRVHADKACIAALGALAHVDFSRTEG